jgi:predicted DNA-binding transcriptional regulator AlpA
MSLVKERTPEEPTRLETIPQNTDLLTPEEKARELKVSYSCLYRWRQRGIGPEYVKIGPRLIRYLPGV